MAGGGGGGGKSNKASSSSSSSGTGKGKKRKAAGGGSGGTGAPRKKSHEQMERRRERNRILARRTRLRKKFIFESLQKQVMDLKRQNTKLKTIVKVNMAEQAPEVLGSCTARLPSIVTESMAEASTLLERGDFNLVKSLQTAQQSFVVTDPSLPDNRKYMWEGGKEGGRGVFLFAILVSLMCPRSFYWCFVLILIPSPPSLPPSPLHSHRLRLARLPRHHRLHHGASPPPPTHPPSLPSPTPSPPTTQPSSSPRKASWTSRATTWGKSSGGTAVSSRGLARTLRLSPRSGREWRLVRIRRWRC